MPENIYELRKTLCTDELRRRGYSSKDVIIRKGKKTDFEVYIKNVHTNLNEIYEICEEFLNINVFNCFEVIKKKK